MGFGNQTNLRLPNPVFFLLITIRSHQIIISLFLRLVDFNRVRQHKNGLVAEPCFMISRFHFDVKSKLGVQQPSRGLSIFSSFFLSLLFFIHFFIRLLERRPNCKSNACRKWLLSWLTLATQAQMWR